MTDTTRPQSPAPLPLRFATPADAAIITGHRRAMFLELGHTDPVMLDTMDANFILWVRDRLERGTYIGWFVVDGETIAAGAGVWLLDWPPTPRDLTGPQAYVLNVYTAPTYRRRGLARQMMTAILAWCKDRNLHVVTLHASKFGRPLYESLNFDATNEMRYVIDQNPK
jgi:GNAT superfamily N-acetyltransferase